MSVENIVSQQLDFSSKVYNHSSPLLVKVLPQSGGTTVSPTVTSPVGPVSFQIPAKVVNLAQSYISFDLSLTLEALKFFNVQGNLGSMFNRVVLSTVNSGVILADISNCGNYLEAVGPVATSFNELISKPSPLATMVNGGADAPGMATGLTAAQLTPVEDISCAQSTVNPAGVGWSTGAAIAATTPFVAPSILPLTAPRYLYTTTTVANNALLSVRFPFSAFKYTALAIDKDLYFAGETLNIDFYFEAATKWAFTNITTAGRPDLTPAAIVAASIPAGCISNLAVYAQCEQNIAITSGIVDRVMKQGLTLPIPVVWSSKQNLAAGAQSITQNITRAHGNKLLAIFWAPYDNTESSATAKAHTIFPLSTTTYQTLLNQVPILTQNLINVAKGEHWTANKASLQGSAIQNIPMFNQQFCHIDNFTGYSMPELSKNTTVYNGIDLTEATQQYQLSVTNGASQLNYYLFWLCQKQLTIAPNAISLM